MRPRIPTRRLARPLRASAAATRAAIPHPPPPPPLPTNATESNQITPIRYPILTPVAGPTKPLASSRTAPDKPPARRRATWRDISPNPLPQPTVGGHPNTPPPSPPRVILRNEPAPLAQPPPQLT